MERRKSATGSAWKLAIAIAALAPSCTLRPASDEDLDLRMQFPEEAARVFSGAAIERTASGFAPANIAVGAPANARALRIAWPEPGEDPIRLVVDDLALEVREIGCAGPGRRDENAIAYGAYTSFWQSAGDTVEERIHAPRGAPSGGVLAEWQILGAELREFNGENDFIGACPLSAHETELEKAVEAALRGRVRSRIKRPVPAARSLPVSMGYSGRRRCPVA